MNEQLYGLTAENMMRTLPGLLSHDEKMQPLGMIAADAIADLTENINVVQIYTRIDELEEQALDILAVDFRADWYDYNYSLATKRAMIRDSFFVHRHLGTKDSITRALADIFPYSTLMEWFEYGGDPYHFRVILDVTNTAEHADFGLIKKKINYHKSLRSHLEDDNLIVRISCGIAIGMSASGIGYSVPRCGTVPAVSTQGGVDDSALNAATFAGGGLYSVPMCGTPFNALM